MSKDSIESFVLDILFNQRFKSMVFVCRWSPLLRGLIEPETADTLSAPDTSNNSDISVPSSIEGTLSSKDPSFVEDTLSPKDPSLVEDTLSSKDHSLVEDTLSSTDPSSVEDTLSSTDPSSVEDTLSSKNPSPVEDNFSSTEPSSVEDSLSSQDSASTKKTPSVEDFSSIKKDLLAKNTDEIRELFNYITSAKGNSSAIHTSQVKDNIPKQDTLPVKGDTTLGEETTPVKDTSAVKDISAAKDTSVIKEALAIKDKLLLEGTTKDKATSTVNNTLEVVSEHSRVKEQTPAASVVTETVTLRSQRKNKFTGKESERFEAHSTEATILEDVPAYRASSARNNPTSSVPGYRSGTNTSKENVPRVGAATNSTRRPQPGNNPESLPATEFPAKVWGGSISTNCLFLS
jgi:hypothetical protein